MPLVERLAEEHGFEVLFYNVDEPGKLERAAAIAAERGLTKAMQIVPGLGEDDPLLKMLISRPGGSPGVPQYLVLDRDGICRYGGGDLEIVKDALADPSRTAESAIAADPDLHLVRVELSGDSASRRVGTFRFRGFEARLEVYDTDGSGALDGSDFDAAPVLAVDLDGDNVIAPAEMIWRSQPFAFRGGNFAIDRIDLERVEFKKTWAPIPRLERRVPGLALPRLAGRILLLNRCDRPRLLAFVALDDVASLEAATAAAAVAEQHGAELLRVFVDVDKAAVGSYVAEHALAGEQVVAMGMGRKDRLWTAFAGLPGLTMSTPMFVLLDDGGVLRHAGHDVGALAPALKRLAPR